MPLPLRHLPLRLGRPVRWENLRRCPPLQLRHLAAKGGADTKEEALISRILAQVRRQPLEFTLLLIVTLVVRVHDEVLQHLAQDGVGGRVDAR